MEEFVFNPIETNSIVVKFTCDKCNHLAESEEISVPEPNYAAEKTSDSYNSNDGYAVCICCKKEFYIVIYASYAGGHGNISNLSDNDSISVHEKFNNDMELLWEIKSEEQLSIFKKHMRSINSLLSQQLDEDTSFSLYVMIYAYIIAAMESYLSSLFIHEVLNSEKLIKKLLESDAIFAKEKFTLREIYSQQEKLKTTVSEYLKSLIFHDIAKVKPMYKNVLDFNFNDIDWLFKAVKKRHDCAHRAGYDKENNKIMITKDEIEELMRNCSNLTEAINIHIVKYK